MNLVERKKERHEKNTWMPNTSVIVWPQYASLQPAEVVSLGL